ncbi:sushi, von Willebrand factor type A, EGF and pentraxin domain-containing protein 1-like, partial [Mercenaria mercenaria]|uniref:sushi, von Willebrand factor type A, EGF and pentraxin domain-containing protein 1-like n=1 Tax=Mercenaria mercenaria TaxID=6596 RepID=UPI00234ECC68
PKVPEVFELETEITYNSSIPKEQQPEVEDQVRKNINDTSCIQSGYCNTTMNFIPNQVGDYTETKLILTFLRNLDYIANNTGFVDQSVLHELQKVVSDLESTADYLIAENVFNVNTSGGLIQADESSLRLEGFINCTKGHIYVNGVCVGCPDSTSKKNHRCEFCPERFFQLLRRQKRSQTTRTPESVDEEKCSFVSVKCPAGQFKKNNECISCQKGFYRNQTSCIACPTGTTTHTNGSNHIGHCFLKCPAGQFKKNNECISCQKGFYRNQTSCIACPTGTTTHTNGSNHIGHCFHHEVLRQGSYVATIAGSVSGTVSAIVAVVGIFIAWRFVW